MTTDDDTTAGEPTSGVILISLTESVCEAAPGDAADRVFQGWLDAADRLGPPAPDPAAPPPPGDDPRPR